VANDLRVLEEITGDGKMLW